MFLTIYNAYSIQCEVHAAGIVLMQFNMIDIKSIIDRTYLRK